MILSDSEIIRRMDMVANNRIVIDPYPKPEAMQAASVDLHLSDKLVFFYKEAQRGLAAEMKNGMFQLDPGRFILGSTIERVEIPKDLAARVEGKSSLGRIGLLVHVTAGFIDPGFKGNITLELKNLSPLPIILKERMAISQMCFEELSGPVARPYGSRGLGSHYQDSEGTVASYLSDGEEDEL